MKVDKIIKNAKIFTSNKDHILASALVVKDGKFVYVGDESGLSEYEGETEDLNGKFIMPGIIDSHVHVTMGAGYSPGFYCGRYPEKSREGSLLLYSRQKASEG